jgi:hypothetical protein
LSLGGGFLIPVFAKVPRAQRDKFKNKLRWVILGDNDQSYVACTLSAGGSGDGDSFNYLVISLS